MNKESEFALVPRPPSALVKVAPAARRVLSAMVTDTLAFAANDYVPRLVRQMCEGKEWGEREQAYLQLRTLGPAFRGWAKSLRDVIYSGDGHARIWAAESLSRFKCNPHDAVPVLIATIDASATADAKATRYGWGRVACGALTNYPELPEEYIEELVAALVGVLQTTQFSDFTALPADQFQFRIYALRLLGMLREKGIGALPTIAPLLEFKGAPPIGDPLFEEYRKTAKNIDSSIESPIDALNIALRFGDAVTRSNAALALQNKRATEDAVTPVDLDALVREGKSLYLSKGKGATEENNRAFKLFLRAAEAGHPEAQFYLGCCYDSSNGVPEDLTEAARWYRKAAEQGHPTAQAMLGYCYNNGDGVEQDYVEAVKWYELAAQKDNALAQVNLAVCYDTGRGVPTDHVKAVGLYSLAAHRGYPTAQANLGLACLLGRGTPKDEINAYKWLKLAAERGHKGAAAELISVEALLSPEQFQEGDRRYREFALPMNHGDEPSQEVLRGADVETSPAITAAQLEDWYRMGDKYYYGRGVPQDYPEAVKWYRKAAAQNHAGAQFDLGWMYHNGFGVEQDYVEAVKWYRKAADQGHTNAQCSLGLCYDRGRGVEKDYAEAVKWYRKAAEQNEDWSQHNLGVMYCNGRGVEQDYVEAVKWYRKAAAQNHAGAQFNLGKMYANGEGVEQDYAEAVKWYRKAAAQNYAYAQNILGKMYANGEGVEQNYVEAYKLYKLAAEQNLKAAEESLEQIVTRMTAVEIAEGERRYREFTAAR